MVDIQLVPVEFHSLKTPTLPIFLLLKNPALTLLNSNFPSIGGGHVKGQFFPPPRVGI
jgi:hypothetical protein